MYWPGNHRKPSHTQRQRHGCICINILCTALWQMAILAQSESELRDPWKRAREKFYGQISVPQTDLGSFTNVFAHKARHCNVCKWESNPTGKYAHCPVNSGRRPKDPTQIGLLDRLQWFWNNRCCEYLANNAATSRPRTSTSHRGKLVRESCSYQENAQCLMIRCV